MNFKELNILSQVCTDVMRCDQYRLQRRIRTLKSKLKSGQNINVKVFEQLSADIEKSLKQHQRRVTNLPTPQFPDDLPVSQRRADIATAIASNQVVVVAGETGSGKTTQLPKICLSLGRGVNGMIGCTQPRRIAARTIAMRVASELESSLGHAVGYKVRFSDRISSDTYIKFMTDGILLAETQGDRFLEAYDTLILDEAHERSLNVDFLLGYIKQLLPKRPDLKLIITSATIDTARFSSHFDNAPVVEVSGRTYPVDVRYRPLFGDEDEEDRNVIQGILDAVDEITAYNRQADILIFLAGERDIRETAEALRKHSLPNTEILPLYARLSAAEQNRVFSPGGQRRIVLATNVAETSLTVPRIKTVIDPGLARISRYSIRNKVQRLPIEKISRSSADQRKGRCGRIAPGLCIRLYSGEDYDTRPEFTDPEILRTSLASVILQMLALRLGDVNEFPFVDPPTPKMINDGFTLLMELEAVDDNRGLTEIGRQLAKLPIDPRIGRMILAAKQENCLQEMLIIASALSIQDPRERPMDAQQAADAAQKRFIEEKSDFLSYLKLWVFFQENAKHLSQNKLRKLCHAHFLSYIRMREWLDIHHQLKTLVREAGWQLNQVEAGFDEIHRALLTGLLGNIAFKTELEKKSTEKKSSASKKSGFTPEEYLGTRNIKVYLFPGSSLFKKQPKWIMAAELVETTKLYARCCAKINPDWIEQAADNLCQHHYFEPHWEKRRAQVGAFEKVTLYGLTIVAKRKVNYGPLDPKLSKEIFIRNALVEGDYYCKAAFFQHNRELFNEIEALEHKSRRQDILVDEEHIYTFYATRIPENIYSGKTFEKWLKQAERDNPKLLFLSREDLMKHTGDSITPQTFPDNLDINGVSLPLSYQFEPGHELDGVTIDIPLALLNQLSAQPFEWLVPGLLEEKIIALLRSMPKVLRRAFVPMPDAAKDALDTIQNPVVTFREGGSFLEYPKEALLDVLIRFCHRRLGKPLPADVWKLETLAPHLLMNFRLVENQGEQGKENIKKGEKETIQGGILDMSRDLIALQQKWGSHASTTSQQQIADKSGLERDKITVWDFGDLQSQVTLKLEEITMQGFPTLIDQETHVDLRVLDNPATAQQELRNGLRRLFLLALPTKKLLKQMPIDSKLSLQYIKVGNSEQLKKDMLIAIVDSLFLMVPLPVKQTEFEQRLAQGKQRLMPAAYEYAKQLANVLEEYNALNQQLRKLSSRSTALPEIKQHLKHLVYEGFVKKISLEQLKHLPRYLKAIQLRLERLDHDPQKDMRKAEQLAPLWEAYWQRCTEDTEFNSKLAEFRWMLEELRVSLFAPELKTAYPVSVQRLQKMWDH
ncbi:ATP-dependent RNA helicase HrpA [Candidatus Parabeggiatoa sp. HSG14]|uniref:ATP-dependent RNA helicase HrpA n=1 Tax=Candidatus Parabeggiatoa sp. HSG14 TaxID=3055593 RepID=UPI0025A6B2E7|nr:ATP-dependent RNA helicase HrpA [Thiotrichales bacterium HSG14]